jgi:transcriptional regulator with XRE-family HTH domain
MWEGGVRVPGRHYWPALAAALRLSEAAVGALFPDHRGARHDGVRLPSLGWARRASGLTQRELAMSVGVAPTTLAMWESAKVRVDPGTAEQLARLLRTDPGRLVAAPPAPAPDPRPLRRLRREAGMSQREAAAHLGIAVGTLARYEAGERSAPVAVVRRMAAAYRRPVEELLRHSGREIRPLPVGARWRPEDVPAAILALRTAAGLTKVDFGRVVGRSGQAVRNWESGRTRPVADTCRRLETVFRLPAGKFPA